MNKTTATRAAAMLAAATLTTGVTMPRQTSAAEANFPNSDGSGNLMSEAAWGGAIPTTDRPKITSSGTYYADPNGTLPGILIGTTGKVVFDMTKSTQAEPKVTMGERFYIGGTGRKVEFIGGTWDFQGQYRIDQGASVLYSDNSVRLDGCNMTNMTHIGFTTWSSNNKDATIWTLDNGSTLHTSGNFMPDHSGKSTVYVYVNGGSRVLAGGNLVLGNYANGTSTFQTADQRVIVSGTGSLLQFGKSGGESYVGQLYCNSLLEARDGGVILRSDGRLVLGGGAYATNNVVRATGTGSTATLGDFYFAYNGAASENRVEALDGADVSASYVTFRGIGNGFTCSNATISIRQFVQHERATNCYVRVQGSSPKVVLSQSGVSQGNNLKQGFRLIFDLPPDGYAYENSGDCPIVANSSATDNCLDATTVIEINGIKGYKEGMARRGARKERIKLAYINCTAYYGQSDIDNIIAGWNAKMPEGATLSTTSRDSADRRRSIYLEVKLDSPTVVSLR